MENIDKLNQDFYLANITDFPIFCVHRMIDYLPSLANQIVRMYRQFCSHCIELSDRPMMAEPN